MEHSLNDTDVTRVTRIDSTRDGALKGFFTGFTPVALTLCAQDDAFACEVGVILAGPMMGGLGAIVGAVIDGMRNKTVYRPGTAAGGRVTMSISPVLSAKTTGASLSLQF